MAIDVEPDVGREPLQPPLAVHEVASVDDHVRVVLLPTVVTVAGFANRETTGVGSGTTSLSDDE